MSVCCRSVNWQARAHRRETHLLRLDKGEELGLDGGSEDGALSVLNTMLEAANGTREEHNVRGSQRHEGNEAQSIGK